MASGVLQNRDERLMQALGIRTSAGLVLAVLPSRCGCRSLCLVCREMCLPASLGLSMKAVRYAELGDGRWNLYINKCFILIKLIN